MRRTARFVVVLMVLALLASACSSDRDTTPPFDPAGAASDPADGSTSNTTIRSTTTTVPFETVEDFFRGFEGAYRTGNPVFLIQRIHPDLLAFYGREACRTRYADFLADDSAQVRIRSVSGPETWVEEFDSATFTFEDVYTIDVDIVDFGFTRRQDMHLARIDNRLFLFEDCGDPLEPIVTTTTTMAIDMDVFDPDDDGLFYVHSGSGDSNDFLVPAMFRVTYTGSATTCAFQLLDAATGTEVRYVTGLDEGGFKRIVLPNPMTTVYVSDVLGCRGGTLEFGPNP